MNFRWNNIIVAVLAMVILAFALRHGASCRAALETVASVAPHERVDDRFVGFMVLGVLAVTLVAIVKILTRNRPNDRQGRRDDPPED